MGENLASKIADFGLSRGEEVYVKKTMVRQEQSISMGPAFSENNPPCQDRLGNLCPPSTGHPTFSDGHSLCFPRVACQFAGWPLSP